LIDIVYVVCVILYFTATVFIFIVVWLHRNGGNAFGYYASIPELA